VEPTLSQISGENDFENKLRFHFCKKVLKLFLFFEREKFESELE
jgi:hypothetical protein